MKLIGHLITITRHRNTVIRLCRKVGIGWQGLGHDLSKYGITELRTGAKYYTGDRSPNSAERAEKGYSEAWLHHKGRNKHHFEYWYDYSEKDKKYMPVPMPMRYLLESFCDRIAASKIYLKDKYVDSFPLQYFNEKGDALLMHPESADKMRSWLTLLAEKGEKEAFSVIKKEYAAYKRSKKQTARSKRT